jgi:hypothetical protein
MIEAASSRRRPVVVSITADLVASRSHGRRAERSSHLILLEITSS